MLEMRRVALKDIRPDANNPRAKFSGIEELAASFDFTPDRPGEPMNPIIVAEDGNIFRIIDGERRFRAMAKAGKVDSCLCVVSDSIEDSDAVAMMLATDKKANLSGDEVAMGVQTMLLLGVDETEAAILANRPESAEKLSVVGRRLRRKGDRKPVQMDFAALMAISDVESDEDADELLDLAADGVGWGSRFATRRDEMMRSVKGKRRHDGFIESLERLGVEWSYGDPGDYDETVFKLAKRVYYHDYADVKRSVEDAVAVNGEVFAVMPRLEEFTEAMNPWQACPSLMAKRDQSEAERSAAEAMRSESIAAVEEVLWSYEKRIEDHVVRLMEDGRMRHMLEGDKACEPLAEAIWSEFSSSSTFLDASNLLDGLFECSEFPNFVTAYALANGILEIECGALAAALVDDQMSDASAQAFSDLAQIYAMVAPTGYVRSNEELSDFNRLEVLSSCYAAEEG